MNVFYFEVLLSPNHVFCCFFEILRIVKKVTFIIFSCNKKSFRVDYVLTHFIE